MLKAYHYCNLLQRTRKRLLLHFSKQRKKLHSIIGVKSSNPRLHLAPQLCVKDC